MTDLLTIDDIATLFRVCRRTVAERWIHQPDFPPPRFAPSKYRRLWDAKDVSAWAAPAARRSAPQTQKTEGNVYAAPQ